MMTAVHHISPTRRSRHPHSSHHPVHSNPQVESAKLLLETQLEYIERVRVSL